MPDQDNSVDIDTNSKTSSKYTANSETERIFSVLESFNKNAEEIESLSANSALGDNEPVLAMSSIGQLGRFGNQLFQYAFLRICAEKSGARVECSPWIGQILFGHQDATITDRLPPAIEQKEDEETIFDIIPEFIPYLEKLAKAKSIRVGAEALNSGIHNVDLWGFFQFHSQVFRPYREYFCSLFEPIGDLKLALEDGLNILRSKGKTIVGIHIRRGDYITEPRIGFTLVFPSKWYCQWLEELWGELEDPVLFLCSDDLDCVLPDFEKFSPITFKELDVKLPNQMKDLDIGFYIDFFMLSHCNVVCTSNSNFSFAACMLNNCAKMFFRPDWDFSKKFTRFDPWDSKPLLSLGDKQPKRLKSLVDVKRVTYTTQGTWVMLKSIFIYVPKSFIRMLATRAYLGYQVQGPAGLFKSFLYTLGWRSAWQQSNKDIWR